MSCLWYVEGMPIFFFPIYLSVDSPPGFYLTHLSIFQIHHSVHKIPDMVREDVKPP